MTSRKQIAPIPLVGVSYELGRSLEIAARDGTTVRLEVNAVTGKRLTRNVLVDAAFNSDSSLTVVGAHLDSVPEGPGINDNGSGSAVVLEAALQLPQGRPKLAVACASHSRAQRSAVSSARAIM